MGIFERISDIVSSNVNHVLDKMEDPEKMIDLSIERLEEAVIEMRGTISEKKVEAKSLERELASKKEALSRWEKRAEIAAKKNEDELAKEAIKEKLRLERIIKSDEECLKSMYDKLKELEDSRISAEEKLDEMNAEAKELKLRAKASKERAKSSSIISESKNAKFERRLEEIRAKIDKWEIEADMMSSRPGNANTAKTFEELEREDEIERELERLKKGEGKES